jgi:hypothetical protein
VSEQSVIVWDLETVPDLAAAARMLDMPNAADAELREALGSGLAREKIRRMTVTTGGRLLSRPVRKPLIGVIKQLCAVRTVHRRLACLALYFCGGVGGD